MALVNVCNMAVLDNPTLFSNPFSFEVTFECLQELDDDLEWKVVYVVNANDQSQDLVLDEILVGPVPVGINKFVLQADAPDPSLIKEDLLGVTVVLVTCSYKEREFVRVGYYVNNEYQYTEEERKKHIEEWKKKEQQQQQQQQAEEKMKQQQQGTKVVKKEEGVKTTTKEEGQKAAAPSSSSSLSSSSLEKTKKEEEAQQKETGVKKEQQDTQTTTTTKEEESKVKEEEKHESSEGPAPKKQKLDPESVKGEVPTSTTTNSNNNEEEDVQDDEEDDDEDDENDDDDEEEEEEVDEKGEIEVEPSASPSDTTKTTPMDGVPPMPPPPQPIDLTRVMRQILADKPRVTKFPISWGDDDNDNGNNKENAAQVQDGFKGESTIVSTE